MSAEAKSIKIQVPKTARYFQLGEASPQVKHLWYVFHGYGQLGEYFIKHFAPLMREDMLVIAPEGHSRFYLDGVFGRVGASWMTKIDRLDEIADQRSYLDALHQQTMAQLNQEEVQITVLGFSQGVATSWRWMKSGGIQPHNFVLWAGVIPQEFPEEWMKQFQQMGFYAVIGDQDKYISQEKAEEYRQKLLKIHPELEWFYFSGDHRLDAPTLNLVHQRIYQP